VRVLALAMFMSRVPVRTSGVVPGRAARFCPPAAHARQSGNRMARIACHGLTGNQHLCCVSMRRARRAPDRELPRCRWAGAVCSGLSAAAAEHFGNAPVEEADVAQPPVPRCGVGADRFPAFKCRGCTLPPRATRGVLCGRCAAWGMGGVPPPGSCDPG